MVAVLAFFLLGRESRQMDISPLVRQISLRLQASQEILQDLLPSHVLFHMMVVRKRELEQEEDRKQDEDSQQPEQLLKQSLGLVDKSDEASKDYEDDWDQRGDGYVGQTDRVSWASLTVSAPPASSPGPLLPSPTVSDPPASRAGPLLPSPSSASFSRQLQSGLQRTMSMIGSGGTKRTSIGNNEGSILNRLRGRPHNQVHHHTSAATGDGYSNGGMDRGGVDGMDQDGVDGGMVSRAASESMLSWRQRRSVGWDPQSTSSTATAAAAGATTNDVAEDHDCVTVLFSDLVGFSTWSSSLPAGMVLRTLNDLYTRLDDIILNEEPGLYKVSSNTHPCHMHHMLPSTASAAGLRASVSQFQTSKQAQTFKRSQTAML